MKREGMIAFAMGAAIFFGATAWFVYDILNASALRSSFLAFEKDVPEMRAMTLKSVPSHLPAYYGYDSSSLKYDWRFMSWVSEAIPMSILAFGRTDFTVGMSNDQYAIVNNNKIFESIFSKVTSYGFMRTRSAPLGKIFQPVWDLEENGAIIVPMIRGQFETMYVSNRIFVFPDGKNAAQDFWNDIARDLVSSETNIFFSDILW